MRDADRTALLAALPEWLPKQRWYGAKGRPIRGMAVLAERELLGGEPACHHVLVELDLGAEREVYQLLVGVRKALPHQLEHARIDRGRPVLYDATHDQEVTHVILDMIAAEEVEDGLAFRQLGGIELNTELTGIVMTAEQSNTSIVFGSDYILKLFRKVAPGVNPDLEVTRALAAAGSTSVVPTLAWLETAWPAGADAGTPTTLAMMQPFLRSASEGWHLAVNSVRDLYAEADLHADEVGGDFAGEAERLGMATAEVHRLMRETLPSRLADASENQSTAKLMHERLDAAMDVAPELIPHAESVRAAYDAVAGLPAGVVVQRVHGDLHLAQALRTDTGWVLIDFEGEPARTLEERTTLMSPLRDVAGMLRSFDYAARHLLAEHPASGGLEYRAAEWSKRNRDAFCVGYGAAAGRDPREDDALLRAFELDKAVYEVVYEARNRPTWLPIPLGSIERLAKGSS